MPIEQFEEELTRQQYKQRRFEEALPLYRRLFKAVPGLAQKLLPHTENGLFNGSLYLFQREEGISGCLLGLTAYYSGQYAEKDVWDSWAEVSHEYPLQFGFTTEETLDMEAPFIFEVKRGETYRDNLLLALLRETIQEFLAESEVTNA